MIHNDQKVIGDIWFQKFGIIKTKDLITGETKFYLGLGSGNNVEVDIAHIIDYGAKYMPEDFKRLLKWLEVE